MGKINGLDVTLFTDMKVQKSGLGSWGTLLHCALVPIYKIHLSLTDLVCVNGSR